MKERPILFKGELVRAILAGTKTQTRRLINPQPSGGVRRSALSPTGVEDGHGRTITLKYGVPGDQLYVRETWGDADHYYQGHVNDCPSVVAYAADHTAIQFDAVKPGPVPTSDIASWNWDKMKWRPSIHMPRWASRVDLEITEVRVQRLQDITEEDVLAEGMRKLSKDGGITWKFGKVDRDGMPGTDDEGWPWSEWTQDPKEAFCKSWDKIYANSASAPWVWAITFRRIRP